MLRQVKSKNSSNNSEIPDSYHLLCVHFMRAKFGNDISVRLMIPMNPIVSSPKATAFSPLDINKHDISSLKCQLMKISKTNLRKIMDHIHPTRLLYICENNNIVSLVGCLIDSFFHRFAVLNDMGCEHICKLYSYYVLVCDHTQCESQDIMIGKF